MTRKKSNVKALALAVTCAILAGGYSGLNPVYAADKLYKEGTGGSAANVTTVASSNTEITELEIAGVRIGTKKTGTTSSPETGRIEAKNIKVSQYLTVGTQLTVPKIVGLSSITNSTGVDVNGVKFASGAAITATSLKLDGIDDVKTAIEAKAAQTDVTNNRNSIGVMNNEKSSCRSSRFCMYCIMCDFIRKRKVCLSNKLRKIKL